MDNAEERIVPSSLPTKLCALVGLPRSGTTLVTSVFSVHSQVRAVFEPWNAKGEDFRNLQPTIDEVAREGMIADLSGKDIFCQRNSFETDLHHERQKTS